MIWGMDRAARDNQDNLAALVVVGRSGVKNEETAMNTITISNSTVRIEITGWDKIWTFKGSLSIPRTSIIKVYKHDGKLRPPFWRCPGTAIPGVIIAGTYYGRRRKEFWNTHFRNGTIVFDLMDIDYTRIVVDVGNADEVLSEFMKGAAS